jgi:hypothetical protein
MVSWCQLGTFNVIQQLGLGTWELYESGTKSSRNSKLRWSQNSKATVQGQKFHSGLPDGSGRKPSGASRAPS